jgi:alcohol dehydrogenase (cytochrome c)
MAPLERTSHGIRRAFPPLVLLATQLSLACALNGGAPYAGASTDRSSEGRAAEDGKEWTSVNANWGNQRYTDLDQINRRTLARLGAVWVSNPFPDGATSRMTPLVHGKLMFLSDGPRLYALDARTGRLTWSRQTETRQPAGTGFEAVMSGLAITRSLGLGLGGGMIFAGQLNGHIMALKEATGEIVWDRMVSEEHLALTQGITCTPLYVDGVLYVGVGSELAEGHVVALDAMTGRVLWRAPTIAEPGEPGHDTWPAHSTIWRSGGAYPWAAGAADPKLQLVYFVTGNAGPATGGDVRPGDNLYSVSVIALEMGTGKLRWYRQLVHHDVWESDLSVPPVLFESKIGRAKHPAIAILRGDGYLFIFDRSTGEPLIPIDERPVPQSAALFTAATQPFPRAADSILPPCESWKDKIPEGFVLGCMFDPPSPEVPNRLSECASVRVAPMSYDPHTGYFYAQGTSSLLWLRRGNDPYVPDERFAGDHVPNYPAMRVFVVAIDGRTDKVVWREELPNYDGSPYKADGGSLSTASGLVFHQGGDGTLHAYDALTGASLWRFQTDFAVGDASPMSYAIDGNQYVAFIAGTKVWSFALGGTLPEAAPIPPPPKEEVTGPIEDTHQIETLSLEQSLAKGHRYILDEYTFNPYRARLTAGSEVTFINNGSLPHTIVARDGSWTTGTLQPTESATITLDRPGSYLYTSKEYPWSYGQVIVLPATSGPNGTAVSDQVARGRAAFQSSCAGCHGDTLAGRDRAPALSGGAFAARWAGHDAAELFARIRKTMPSNAPDSLGDETYAAIVAYLLDANASAPAAPIAPGTMSTTPVIAR